MIRENVHFRKLIQTDSNDKGSWIELSYYGFVPTMPQIGVYIFLKEVDSSFIVHGVSMTSEEDDKDGVITLYEINPIAGKMSEKDNKEMQNFYFAKGWQIDNLASNVRQALESMGLIKIMKA